MANALTVPGCLYRVYDGQGTLLYIGASTNLGQRLVDHQQSSTWWREVAKVTVEQFRSRAEARAAEMIAIRQDRPLYNALGNGYRTQGQARHAAREHRAEAIRAAVASGLSHEDVAMLAGLSFQRVQQIVKQDRQ